MALVLLLAPVVPPSQTSAGEPEVREAPVPPANAGGLVAPRHSKALLALSIFVTVLVLGSGG